jgi:hypothetical protein
MKTITINKKIIDHNIIEVELKHNGLQGGDAGHGGFVSITIKDITSTCMELNGKDCQSFNITFRGDSERRTLINALKMIIEELLK